jgi:hypothetical protein
LQETQGNLNHAGVVAAQDLQHVGLDALDACAPQSTTTPTQLEIEHKTRQTHAPSYFSAIPRIDSSAMLKFSWSVTVWQKRGEGWH